VELPRSQPSSKGLGAQPPRFHGPGVVGEAKETAESADVGVEQRALWGQLEGEAEMGRGVTGPFGTPVKELSRHPQIDQEDSSLREPEDDVLTATGDPLDLPTLQLPSEGGGRLSKEVFSKDPDTENSASRHP